jgi:peptidoglycan/xylan/chitin deacetylase (PgdA/CDA1 family)
VPIFLDPVARRRAERDRRVRRRRQAVLLVLIIAIVLIGAAIGRASRGSDVQPPYEVPAAAASGAAAVTAHPTARVVTATPTRSREDQARDAVQNVRVRTPWVKHAGGQRREVALTFDDGPGPYTPAILAVLRRYKVKATFFAVGTMEIAFHASTRAAVQAGHVVANHTESHARLTALAGAGQREEIDAQTDRLRLASAPAPDLFRPPYGVFDFDTLKLLHERRMLLVLWSVDSEDYLRPGAGTITRNVLTRTHPGAIILLHDGGGDRSQTVAALPAIIGRLRARGYRLVTVPQLLLDNPPQRAQRLPPFAAGAFRSAR